MPYGRTVVHHLEGLNDEPAHFNYGRFLAEKKQLPVLEHFVLEKDAFVRNEFEYHQAPLYYLLCAPFFLMLGDTGALMAARLVSALAGLLTLWVLALLLRDLGYPKRAQFAAVVFTGLLPSHVYFSSFVSNDSLSWLFALLVTRGLVRHALLLRNGTRPSVTRSAVMVTVWLAAGLLTKSSLALFVPFPALWLGFIFLRTGNRTALVHGLAITGTASIVAAPWYIRNFLLYHTFSGIPPSTVGVPVSVSSMSGFFKGTVKYFWFPMQHLEGGTVAFMLLTLCGGTICILHAAAAGWWLVRNMRLRTLAAETSLMIALLALVTLVHAWYYVEWLNPEARFLFPALGPLMLFMIAPVFELFSRFNAQRVTVFWFFLIALFPYPFLLMAG
ncbi:MAG: phospholipid carrier-dependent glycosyltransferase [Chitinispirillaceae bacterium]|nr:phospholipid carrier-dependent glycosyltransferase [Chitinispirillaceae bacterium]